MLRRLTLVATLLFCVVPAMAFAQEEEAFNLGPLFIQMIPAFFAALLYVVTFFIPKVKAKIPATIRPVIPSILALGGGMLSGLVNDGTSALAAAFIGAATSLLYNIEKKWKESKTGGGG